MAPVYQHITLPEGVLPGQVVNLGTTFGFFFLAQCFNWMFYGILLLQVYIYYLRFPKDLTYIKVLVYSLLFTDSFFMATVTHAGWVVLVSNWGDVNILHSLPWTWALLPVGTGLVSMIVQLFFVWRIWKLSKQWIMPALITFFTVAQCAFAIKTGFIAADVRTFHYIRDFLTGFWLVGSIIADVLTSITLVRILWKSQTGFKDTDGVVLRLIRLSVEAAAVPVIAASIKLALIYSYHDNRHLVFCVVLGRLYSNVFMAMLNCRDPLFGGGSNPNTMAGAARLTDGPQTFMSMLKSKFTFTSSRTSTTEVTVTSRDRYASYQPYDSKAEKIMVQKQTRSHADFDTDGRRVSFPDRQSTYSINSSRASSAYALDEITESNPAPAPTPASLSAQAPPSPTTAIATGQWMLKSPTEGTYETKSELVVGTGHGYNVARVMVAMPERAASRMSQNLNADDLIFPGRS